MCLKEKNLESNIFGPPKPSLFETELYGLCAARMRRRVPGFGVCTLRQEGVSAYDAFISPLGVNVQCDFPAHRESYSSEMVCLDLNKEALKGSMASKTAARAGNYFRISALLSVSINSLILMVV